MARFKRKRGQVGWPGPQVRQIEGWCRTYGIEVEKQTASTGTVYLTLGAPSFCGSQCPYANDPAVKDCGDCPAVEVEVEPVTVRVGDHEDCYASATYNVAPHEDDRESVRAWVVKNGRKA